MRPTFHRLVVTTLFIINVGGAFGFRAVVTTNNSTCFYLPKLDNGTRLCSSRTRHSVSSAYKKRPDRPTPAESTRVHVYLGSSLKIYNSSQVPIRQETSNYVSCHSYLSHLLKRQLRIAMESKGDNNFLSSCLTSAFSKYYTD